jgi:fatty-acid desaturase
LVFDNFGPKDKNMNRLGDKFRNGLDWPTVMWISGVMLLASLAVYFYTLPALLLALALAILTGISVTLGYHRYFTHASFKTYRLVRWFLAFVGQLSGEGSVLHWVAQHRKHHQFSDIEGDPHSPHAFRGLMGFLWAHVLWMLSRMSREERRGLHAKYASDLLKEPLFRILDTTYLMWHAALGIIIFVVGWQHWDLFTATSMVVWGMFVRMTFVLHSTWLINSATHLWGYRNYATPDHSTNLWWLAPFTFGEAWHNNHHAMPTAANHGKRWYEKLLDPTYQIICIMGWLGLAWDIKRNNLAPDY